MGIPSGIPNKIPPGVKTPGVKNNIVNFRRTASPKEPTRTSVKPSQLPKLEKYFGRDSDLRKIVRIGGKAALNELTKPPNLKNNPPDSGTPNDKSPKLPQGQAGVRYRVYYKFTFISGTNWNIVAGYNFYFAELKYGLIDRALALLTFVTTLHNALQLSNNIGTTLFSLFDNVLNSFGAKIKNEKGEDIGIGQAIKNSIVSFANTILGTENVKNLTVNWKKANRIYQSTANIVNSVRSMVDSVRNISEYTAENTGRIGNALKTYQVIAPDAFKWMPEQVNGQSIWMQRLQSLEETASGLEMVSSEILSISENINEINKQKEEFIKSIEDLPKKEQTENKAVKTAADTSKTVSTTPNIPEISSDADKESDV